VLDQIRDRERLAAAGDTEQGLRRCALRESADERLDGCGLVALGREVASQSERHGDANPLRLCTAFKVPRCKYWPLEKET
jgi:hypothetical protein